MKLIAFLVLLALAAPYVAMAQSNSTNGTCSACQQFFVVTGQNLYRIDGNGTKTLCESDFCFATGVTVNKNGTVFVADEGAKAIYSVPATCDSNKTLVAKNDGKFTSWLHPHDITVDDENNLYVSMMDFDPLWPLYPLERQVLAKEKHVYKLSVDENFNFTGKFSILAGGINNGRDIVHVRWSEDGLWGTRRNRFVAKFVNNLWEDWLGPNNDFRISEDAPQLLSLHQIDPGFSRCGYLAIASDAAKQFYTCSNFSDVSSCNSSCPASQSSNSSLEANLIHRAAGQCVSDDCIGVQSTTLSFDQTDNSGGNQDYSSQAECNNLLIPYSVVIDCECNLMVGDFAAQSIYKFSNSNSTSSSSSSSSSSSNSSQSLSFSSEGSVVEFSEPVFGMALFLPKNCSSSSSSSD